MASLAQQLSLFANDSEPMSYKRCLKCLEVKDCSHFGLDNSARDKKYRYCRSCAWPNNGIYLMGRGDDGASKVCPKCKQRRDYGEFFKSSTASDGMKAHCKPCMKSYRAHHEEVQKKENPDLVKHRNRQTYERHKKKLHANPEAYKVYLQQQYQKLKAKCEADPEYAERKRQQARESGNKRFRRLYDTEIGRAKILSIWHRRRARLKGNGGSYTQQEWLRLCGYFDNRCLRCGEAKALTVDHVKPLSMGGTNDISNLQPLCGSCNVRKHAHHVDYRSDLGFLCPEMSTQT